MSVAQTGSWHNPVGVDYVRANYPRLPRCGNLGLEDAIPLGFSFGIQLGIWLGDSQTPTFSSLGRKYVEAEDLPRDAIDMHRRLQGP